MSGKGTTLCYFSYLYLMNLLISFLAGKDPAESRFRKGNICKVDMGKRD